MDLIKSTWPPDERQYQVAGSAFSADVLVMVGTEQPKNAPRFGKSPRTPSSSGRVPARLLTANFQAAMHSRAEAYLIAAQAILNAARCVRWCEMSGSAADLPVPREAYRPFQAVCHWMVAFLCVVAFPTAGAIRKVHMGHVFGIRGSALDQFMAWAHEWGGWLLLALTLLLFFSRLRGGAPPLPVDMSTWQRRLAHGAHFAIYVGLVSLVASGATAIYGGGKLAAFHATLTKAGIALIGLHVAAAAWHQLIRRDGLLWRMWPRG